MVPVPHNVRYCGYGSLGAFRPAASEYSTPVLLGCRHQGRLFVSQTLLSCITGRLLHGDTNGMLLCENSCKYRNLKAAFILSFYFCEELTAMN